MTHCQKCGAIGRGFTEVGRCRACGQLPSIPAAEAELRAHTSAAGPEVANDCTECTIGLIVRRDAEHCEACCEHRLCLFHEGADYGAGWAIDTAKKAWGL